MRMVFKYPGRTKLHGIMCDWRTVPNTAQSLAEAEAEGWYQSPALAYEASLKPAEPVAEPDTRDELVKLAESLGIKVDGRWSVARLKQEIDRVDDGDA